MHCVNLQCPKFLTVPGPDQVDPLLHLLGAQCGLHQPHERVSPGRGAGAGHWQCQSTGRPGWVNWHMSTLIAFTTGTLAVPVYCETWPGKLAQEYLAFSIKMAHEYLAFSTASPSPPSVVQEFPARVHGGQYQEGAGQQVGLQTCGTG